MTWALHLFPLGLISFSCLFWDKCNDICMYFLICHQFNSWLHYNKTLNKVTEYQCAWHQLEHMGKTDFKQIEPTKTTFEILTKNKLICSSSVRCSVHTASQRRRIWSPRGSTKSYWILNIHKLPVWRWQYFQRCNFYQELKLQVVRHCSTLASLNWLSNQTHIRSSKFDKIALLRYFFTKYFS